MIDSKIDAVDAINNVTSDLAGASDTLCYWATIDGEDLAAMLARVLYEDVDALREVSRWLETSLDAPSTP